MTPSLPNLLGAYLLSPYIVTGSDVDHKRLRAMSDDIVKAGSWRFKVIRSKTNYGRKSHAGFRLCLKQPFLRSTREDDHMHTNVTVSKINRNAQLLYVDGQEYTKLDEHYEYEFSAVTDEFQLSGTIILKKSLTFEQAEERIKELMIHERI